MEGGRPSHLRAAVRLALAGVRRQRRGGPRVRPQPSRKLAVERRGIEPSAARVRRYLAATRGEGLFDPADSAAALPPTYPAVWETALILEMLALEGMPFPSGGAIHLGSEIVVVRPLTMSDRIRCRIELDGLEAQSGGAEIALRCRSWDAAGQLCQENRTSLLVRGRDAAGMTVGRGRARGSTGGETAPTWSEVAAWSLPADAGVRYARASGDFNPIHLWPWSSRLLGFPRPILHGHCSLAMISHELTRQTDRPLRRIEARFRAPLELPARVRLEVGGSPGEGSVPFRLSNPNGGATPYVEGSWVGGAEP